MKKIMMGFLAIICALNMQANEPETIESTIKSVTVFTRGAQVTREGKFTLKAGKNEIVFTGMETNIDKRTIQATAPPEIIIVSVSHEVNYLREKEELPRIKKLNDSLKIYQRDLGDLRMGRTVLDKELNMVLANQDLKGQDNGLTTEELEKAANFFRRRLKDIYSQQLKNSREQDAINRKISKVNAQLSELNYQKNQPSNDIVVLIEAQRPKTIDLALRYFVADAGWVPAYDLRSNNTEGPINLNYRAEVWQRTGHDWKDVFLTLSTGNPNQGGTKPYLGMWNLAVYRPAPEISARGGRATAAPAFKTESRAMDAYAESEDEEADDDWGGDAIEEVAVEKEKDYGFFDETSLASFTQVSEGATTAEFKIQLKQDVMSGEKPQQVTIQKSELPAMYQHFAVPKLDKDAFLLARVTDWEDLNLLPGKVNIFFEGTYVGQAKMNADFTQDTLDFSMGRDKKVVIDRQQLKNFNRTKTIGGSQERTFGYEITVRNTKNEAVSLVMEENIPVTQDKDISVKVEELSGGRLEEKTGKVSWEIDLKPQETKVIKFVFKVKSPKNKPVTGW